MNFGFSNPIRVNELFRPILQELSLEENISFEKLKNKVLQNINRVNQNEPVDIIGNNLNFQILFILGFLVTFLNVIIEKKINFLSFSLTKNEIPTTANKIKNAVLILHCSVSG